MNPPSPVILGPAVACLFYKPYERAITSTKPCRNLSCVNPSGTRFKSVVLPSHELERIGGIAVKFKLTTVPYVYHGFRKF